MRNRQEGGGNGLMAVDDMQIAGILVRSVDRKLSKEV